MTTGALLLWSMALGAAAEAAAPPENDPAQATSACGCCAAACARNLEGGFLDERRCRPAYWSCWNDPAQSCVALAWAPVRIGIAWVLLPAILVEPKCGRTSDLPDCGSVALFFAFGLPLRVCPEPNIPDDEPPPPPSDRAALRY